MIRKILVFVGVVNIFLWGNFKGFQMTGLPIDAGVKFMITLDAGFTPILCLRKSKYSLPLQGLTGIGVENNRA
ncbi:MAG: hypothetical protein F4X57_09420 [Chloroflexi bacterium]|nr:hypothetical protein [Chloroflexota bacterium]